MKQKSLAIVCPQMARVVSIHCPIKASGSTYRLNPLPCRWERYSPIGGRIEDSPFIAFKVPLSKVRKICLVVCIFVNKGDIVACNLHSFQINTSTMRFGL